MTRATRNRLCEAALLVAAVAAPGMAQQVTGTPGSPDATTTVSGKQLPAAGPQVRRRHQRQRLAIEGLVAAASGAAQGRTERSC